MDNFHKTFSAASEKPRTEDGGSQQLQQAVEFFTVRGRQPAGLGSVWTTERAWKHWILPTLCSLSDHHKSWNSLLVPCAWWWDWCFDAERKM